MTPATKNKLIIIGTSTVIGFVGDLTMYSIAASKGKKFKIHFPEGKALLQVIAIGMVTGVLIDIAMNRIVQSLAVAEEKELDKLVKEEKSRIYAGEIKGLSPQKVVWV